MNPDEVKSWQDAILDDIFIAIAASPPLTSTLVFKGARVLARHLPEAARQSLDIDANCSNAFLEEYPERSEQARVLQGYLTDALHRHFESQSPVRYRLGSVRVLPKPPKGHPRGWNAFEIRLQVTDLARPAQSRVPSLQLDIAYPEALTEHSTTTLDVGGGNITAYTLERIAGEKLRAFLSSLPCYQRKISRNAGAIRVKDLYDLTHILRHYSFDDESFWNQVGQEFRVACESRGVDCNGWLSFAEEADLVRATYERETVLPRDLGFDTIWAALKSIVTELERRGVTPFEFPLPALLIE